MHWKVTMLVLLAGVLFIPWMGLPAYVVVLTTNVFMHIALAQSWTILGGYAGYMSLGLVTFFGLGAYTTALLMLQLQWNPFLTFPLAGLTAGVLSLALAYPLLKVRGAYFSVITMLVALIASLVVKNIPALGGSTGLFLPLLKVPVATHRMIFYYAMLCMAMLGSLLSYWVFHSKLGAGLAAIRENEDVAEAVAVQTTRTKLTAFVLSSTMAGLVGGIYSYMRAFISPEIVFDPQLSLLIFLMALFGGSQHWMGPILGATVLTIVGDVMTVTIGAEAAKIAFGFFMILVIVLMPGGLYSMLSRRRKVSGNTV